MAYRPPVGFHFLVQFEFSSSTHDMLFQDVGGMTMSLETENVNEGGNNEFTYKLPTRASYTNLTLKRAMRIDSEVLNWCREAIENFNIEPANVLVMLLNENHEPIRGFSFINAYPVKWSISNLNAESSSIVVESIELYYQMFRML